MHITERSLAVPAVLLCVLTVHFATFVNFNLVLDQLGIILQLLQLDVPEKFLEATYGRLLVRRRWHRVIMKRKMTSRCETSPLRGHAIQSSSGFSEWNILLFDLENAQVPHFAYVSHNYCNHLCRNLYELSRLLTFTTTRMLITSQNHLLTSISQDERYFMLILIHQIFRRNIIMLFHALPW